MIQFLVGEKGQGKTKKLIEMTNEQAKTSDGHVVFIEHDKRHMYDLHYDVRFVETANFPLSNYREFIGFICGILSQDSDIQDIFVDGYTKVVRDVDDDSLIKLVKKLENLSVINSVNFTISISLEPEKFPDEIKKYILV